MALYFFDSSALVKRYVHEQGSVWANMARTPFTSVGSSADSPEPILGLQEGTCDKRQ